VLAFILPQIDLEGDGPSYYPATHCGHSDRYLHIKNRIGARRLRGQTAHRTLALRMLVLRWNGGFRSTSLANAEKASRLQAR